jgi:Ca2+-binding RTX toxin-like protein
MRRNKFQTRRKFERLEDRRMMTADFFEYDEENLELTINGTDANDVATVRFFAEVDNEGEEDEEVEYKVEVEIDNGDDEDEFTRLISEVTKITFNGGDGDDKLTVSVEDLDQGVSVDLIELFFNGGADNDELAQNGGGIKTAADGGSGDDKLEGSRFNDTLIGGANNDTYVFRGRNVGSDTIQEAANVDTDTLDFSGFDTFVSVDLERVFSANNPSFVATGFMTNLQLKQSNATGLENVVGSASTDTIRGNARPNHFLGGDEDDKLEGRRGNDILEGEAGNDTYEFGGTNLGTDDIVEAANSGDDRLRFSSMESGVTVDISKAGTQFAVDSADLRLRLANDTAIESIFGSRFGDVITGNSRNNNLRGLDGNDTIRGGAGVDILNGGADDDILLSDALDEAVFGGTGRDRFDNFFLYESVLDTRNGIPARFKDVGLI